MIQLLGPLDSISPDRHDQVMAFRLSAWPHLQSHSPGAKMRVPASSTAPGTANSASWLRPLLWSSADRLPLWRPQQPWSLPPVPYLQLPPRRFEPIQVSARMTSRCTLSAFASSCWASNTCASASFATLSSVTCRGVSRARA